MSYNSNYYQKFRGKSTFQGNMQMFVPPPPAPPQYFLPPVQQRHSVITDENFVKQFECKISRQLPPKPENTVSISKVHEQIRNLALALKNIKTEQKVLSDKITDLSDDEWSLHLKSVEENKATISKILSNINNLNTDVLRKLLAKRASKRARQKRQRIEKRKYKEDLKKQKEEKSRKIDEYLQKFQDDMNKAKQEEQAKLQADSILKETIRKKQDAKKYLVKLDALIKLRKARYNTAKGRGEKVSEKEAEVFENNIEKLKSLWSHRLSIYDKEESELRTKLKQDSEEIDSKQKETEKEVADNLKLWREVLFGGGLPQVDFAGDVARFVATRSQWDQYLNNEGSSIPIGWVPLTAKWSEENL